MVKMYWKHWKKNKPKKSDPLSCNTAGKRIFLVCWKENLRKEGKTGMIKENPPPGFDIYLCRWTSHGVESGWEQVVFVNKKGMMAF